MRGFFSIALLSLQLTTGISGQQVRFASELKEWDPQAFPMHETAPGHYSVELPEPWLHELQYKFVVDGKWIQDPGNSKQVPDGQGGFNSVLEFPDFIEDPMLTLKPGVQPLQRSTITLHDWNGAERTVTLAYRSNLPARNSAHVKILYFQDGDDYLEKAFASEILANLAAEPNGPVFIGVFVPPVDRTREYGLTEDSDPYVDFVVKTVIPAAEERLGLKFSAADRYLVGDSLGGLISLYTAIRYPDLFAGVISQSGAWPRANGRILDLLRAAPPKGLRLFAEAGLYDLPGFLEWNRTLSQAAREAGLSVTDGEFPHTHDWIGWRNRLPKLLGQL